MYKKSKYVYSNGRNFSWLYPLIVTAIALPVVCVFWLLQEARKSEHDVLANLVDDIHVQALEDFEREIYLSFVKRVDETVSLYQSSGYNVPYLFIEAVRLGIAGTVVVRTGDERPFTYDDVSARALLNQVNKLEGDPHLLTKVLGLIEDDEVRSLRFRSGRNAALMALMVALDLLDLEGDVSEEVQKTMEAVVDGTLRFEMPFAQYSYFCRKYSRFSKGIESELFIQKLDASREWSGDVDVEDFFFKDEVGVARLGNMIGFRGRNEEFELLFSDSDFAEIIEGLDSRFEIFDSHSGDPLNYAATRQFGAPLDHFSIALRESMSPESSGRIRFYLIIGVIVLVLSVVSGVVTLLLMFRQRDAAQLKNDLVATVTHELKTPVASMRLLVDTMRDPSRAEFVDTQDYLALIDKENKRLGYLIDNFLSFSRMEREKSRFDLRRIDALAVAKNACDVLGDRFKDIEYSLQLDYDDDVSEIMGDPEALATALGNLLENALKYGGSEPKILLRLQRGEGGASFSVIDDGNGISKSDQKRIFRKFYQVKRRLSNHIGGVGLGLSIVSFVVSKHGGEVSVDSEIGKGSCFTITIPYA